MKKDKTLFDHAVVMFTKKAYNAPTWQDFWCDCMNTAKGNVSSLVKIFAHAGVSTTDIQTAYLQFREKQFTL